MLTHQVDRYSCRRRTPARISTHFFTSHETGRKRYVQTFCNFIFTQANAAPAPATCAACNPCTGAEEFIDATTQCKPGLFPTEVECNSR